MFLSYILIIIVLSLFTVAAIFLRQRMPSDVLRDLKQEQEIQQNRDKTQIFKFSFVANALKDFSHLKILTENELKAQEKVIISFIVLLALIGVALACAVGKTNIANLLLFMIAGACLGYLLSQSRLRSKEEQFKQQIVFYLPVVMERIVMAIQSGLDIVPAIKVIDQIEMQVNAAKPDSKLDPVTLLLKRVVSLTEAGLSFEAAVQDVTKLVDSHAFKHALIHLAVAQREGGELFYPLRELSDATQLYFQENVEEEIAKMPIKATLPLLITFAGLLVTFMTGPLIQIMNVSANPTFISGSTQNQKSDGKD